MPDNKIKSTTPTSSANEELPLLTDSEREQLVEHWNATSTGYPREQCIHQLFEAQASRTPDATAVVFENRQMTYAEINSKANQLAHYLKGIGVGPDVPVAIFVERSPEMVVGILGILKAGGAYVPLDLSYPKERLGFMLDDTGAPVLLTQQALRGQLPAYGKEVLCLDRDWERIEGECRDNPRSHVTSDNLAYVIYTSGSTGTPKGVAVPHHGVVRLVINTDYIQLGSSDRIAQVANCSFDAATFEIWGALLCGGQLVIIDKDIVLAPLEFSKELKRTGITSMVLTTALFNQTAAQVPEAFASLKYLMFGGEAADPRSVRTVVENYPPQNLLHVYGPTENTTFTTWYPVREVGEGAATVPIGRPIANTQVYVLDEQLTPVPVGVSGELYIGGDGLARGYLNQPELTEEMFIRHPFSENPEARLYKTGDLARYQPDGNIEFLGRIDNQVKLRGFRIELGEIEAVLSAYPEVQHAVVAVHETMPGNKRLVAYIVSRKGCGLSVKALRAHLKRWLPAYMVPSAFVSLDALPLTPNGKVDRKALPAPEEARPELEEAFIVPRTPVEKLIAGLWREVLAVERVGVHDNFFELGGDSLRATQVLARAREDLGLELPQKDFYDDATVAGLAAVVVSTGGDAVLPGPGMEQRKEGQRDFPLSFAQERAWFLQQLEPASRLAYQTQCTMRFRGELNVKALCTALTEVVRRHEILCTTFPTVDGAPVQRVHTPEPVEVPINDLTDLPSEQREHRAEKEISAFLHQLINIETGPLACWMLLRLDAEEHILVQVEHHLVHDGWSFTVLLRELFEFYRAFSRNQTPSLPAPQWQFFDFALWQRKQIAEGRVKDQLAFWESRLQGAPNLDLPTDFPRPPKQQFCGVAPRFDLDRRLDEAVEKLSRQERASRFMTMLAAFSLLLSRYSSQDDVCIGTGIANRRWKFTEDLIGMLLNNIVLRIDLGGELTFRELLQRVRSTTLEAYANQDAPFDKVVETVRPMRDSSRNPLFQVMFSFHDSPMPDMTLPDLSVELAEGLSNGSAKFDMNIVVIPPAHDSASRSRNAEGNGTIIWEYNSALFEPSTIEQMVRHYLALLEAAVCEPDIPLSLLRWPGEVERRRLLDDWNMTQRDYPRDSSIHKVFERQVAIRGGATALEFEGLTLSYSELNTRANRLAHYLRARGVGPEILVGICVERSLEMVVGILGILKAGGAYLPLDPAYPQRRLAFMMEDAKAGLLLTQSGLLDELPAFKGEAVCLDRDWEEIGHERDDNPETNTHGGNLAYVMYTSGSTGEPKGTCIEHRSVLRLVQHTNYLQMGPDEVYLQLAPISFDAATLELWGSLLNGSRLVVFPAHMPLLDELADVIVRKGVTTLWLTAALFHEMVEHQLDALLQVRQVLSGGDVLSVSHVQRVLEHLKEGHKLINGYGPTESTTFTCCHVMDNSDKVGRTVPIGRPISNTQVYILDGQLNPVPAGVPGELYIGGDGLARGYLNRPALTAEKFIRHPFSEDRQARVYKTGDLVRYRPDGNIEFIGRVDHQVKLRGFRIELGEIEAVLSEHPDVSQVVVVMHETAPGNKRLIAYVVPRDGYDISLEALRAHLKQRLPSHMVPSAFVYLDALPLTPNGKVDRKALPAPEEARLELEEAFVAPRTPVEELIAGIWREVLSVERVGVHDNFFELGGHSLLVTQVVTRLRNALGVDLPLRTVFESPTIVTLAVAIESATSVGHKKNTNAIPVIPRGTSRLGTRPEGRGTPWLKSAADDKAGGK